MTIRVRWGRHNDTTVEDAEALRYLLDVISAQRGEADTGYVVQVTRGDGKDGVEWMNIGVGEQRSFLFWTVGGGWAGQPDIEPLTEDLWFDYGGVPTDYEPEQTRVLPEVAREAAVEYAATGTLTKAPVEFGDEYCPF